MDLKKDPKDQELEGITPQPEAEEPGTPSASTGEESNLPKTQAELDELIEKRLARERKKLAREQKAAVQQPETPAPSTDTAAIESVHRELLMAKAQLEAYRNGVSSAAVEDAVLLAVMQAEKNGEADEEGVRDALADVLKRHPEWKPAKKDAKGEGFKIGVDHTEGTDKKDGANKKALSYGKVIF